MRTRDVIKAMNRGTKVSATSGEWSCPSGIVVGKGMFGWYVEGRWSDGKNELGRLDAYVGDIRLCAPVPAEAPAPKFEVGDLVDCDGAADIQGWSCVGGKIVAKGKYNGVYLSKVVSFSVDGSWKNTVDGRTCENWRVYASQMRPHVPAPKVEPVKEAAPKFEVGDLVDCDESRNTKATVVRGQLVGIRDIFGVGRGPDTVVHVEGKWSDGYRVHSCYFRQLRPHVPAPKSEPVKKPAVGTPEWAEEMGKRGEKVRHDGMAYATRFVEFKDGKWLWDDGDETRSPTSNWWMGGRVWSIYTPSTKLDAGTKTAIAVLESKRGEALGTMGEEIVAAKAKWGTIIVDLDKAIAILKGETP